MTGTIETTVEGVTQEDAERVLRLIRDAMARGKNPASVAKRLAPKDRQIMKAIISGISARGNG